MFELILTIFIIILLDGWVSAAESAIFSIPLNRARFLARKSKRGGVLLNIKETISKPLVTLTALSNIITIAGSIIAGFLATDLFGDKWISLFTAVLTFLIIVLAEIIPKNLGEKFAEPIALRVAWPIKIISMIFFPVIWVIEKLTSPFAPKNRTSISEDEISFLSEIGVKEGTIESYDNDLIQKVFKLKDITAADMMTPKSFVFFLDGNKTLGETEPLIRETRHSRIPIYDKTTDNILGIARQKDLLLASIEGKSGLLLKDLIKSEPLVVPAKKLGDNLLHDFQKTKQQLAIVVNEHGGVIGIVSIEDVLEELVGEIAEEKDISPELIKRISKTEVLVHGETSVVKFNHFFNAEMPSHSTMNGFLMDRFGKLPKIGQGLEIGDLIFIIESVSLNAIEKVKVVRKA